MKSSGEIPVMTTPSPSEQSVLVTSSSVLFGPMKAKMARLAKLAMPTVDTRKTAASKVEPWAMAYDGRYM